MLVGTNFTGLVTSTPEIDVRILMSFEREPLTSDQISLRDQKQKERYRRRSALTKTWSSRRQLLYTIGTPLHTHTTFSLSSH